MPARRGGGRGGLGGEMTLAMLQRPMTTQSRIVFCYMFDQYIKSEFNPNATQGRVTEADVDRVLQAVANAKYFKAQLSPVYLLAFLAVFILTNGFFVLLFFYITLGMKSKDQMTYIFIIPLGFVVTFISLIVLGCKVTEKSRQILAMREQEINMILDDFNKNEYSMKQISWKAGKYGSWLQMDLNFVTGSGGNGGGGFNNNNMGGNKYGNAFNINNQFIPAAM